jgi:L-seryl-tRNA(Ser) seleniumtransferase
VGAGSFPEAKLPTSLVRLETDTPRALELAARLRHADPPLVARIEADRVVLDPRTILPGEEAQIARLVRAALDG